MAEKNKKELTPFQKEQVEVAKKIKEYKLNTEANIVSIFYKNPDLMIGTNLSIDEFTDNTWKVYFTIANDLVINQGKRGLDDISIGMYLDQHDKLRRKYEEYGGYDTIEAAKEYVNIDNLDGYIKELRKWNVVAKLVRAGFPVKDRLSDYADMSAEDIYAEFETFLNHTFINIDSEVKSYNAFEGIHALIDNLNNGSEIGMPLYNAPLLTNEIAGINKGHIYGLGAGSGVGKSCLSFNWLAPSAIEYNRQIVYIINEEDESKFRREMIVWVANNVFHEDLQKYVLRNGHFDDQVMQSLRKCADWIEDKREQRLITIIPLEHYSVNIVIKIINKYSALNPDVVFCLDTLKESCDAETDEIYKSMMRDMVKLYDTVKPANKNVPLFVTYQLGKSSLKLRHLTNSEIGQARSIVDVFSANIMCRRPYDDEYEGGRNELYCYVPDKNIRGHEEKKQKKLKREDNPMIIFVTKNRFGVTDQYQIVSSCDFGRNVCKDICYCSVPQDY